MKTLKSTAVFFPIFLLCAGALLFAQREPRNTDLPASSDHPAISRYRGAVIQNYETTDFGSYVLGTGDPEEKSFRGRGKYFSSFLDLEGRITRIQYLIPKSEGLLKVYRNYEEALREAGFEILYATSHEETGWPFWNEDLYNKDGGINALKGDFYVPFGRSGFHFLAAQGSSEGKDLYAAIFINYGSEHGKEFVLVTQDVIESDPMAAGLVTAKKMDASIASKGRVAVYGIHFDTGKADIQPGSEPVLEEIAGFIKSNSDSRYYIVGHTDNVGGFAMNMALSHKRAEAVVRYLTEVLGVNPRLLEPHGAGPLAPLSSNQTEEGRARNRRVELVEQ